MFKIDENYSDYYMNDPVKYPGGGAVNSSGPDAIDGTPWLAKIFNNSIGWMQALYIKAFGSLEGISNDAENVQAEELFGTDGIHLTEKGYELLGRFVAGGLISDAGLE